MATTKPPHVRKPYVLTKKDALALLSATVDYVHTPDRAIDGKDRADILAEAALAKGFSGLSTTISAIHSSVMEFHKGNYKGMQFLLEGPAIREYVKEEAKGTGFEKAVERAFNSLGRIADLDEKLVGRCVDWDASSKMIMKAKAEHFPEDLTMVEKLTVAKSSAPKRGK